MNREQYIESLKLKNKEFMSSTRTLVEYKRNKKGQREGVVVSFLEDGILKVGWSKCKMKDDKFDKHLGIAKALERARPYDFAISPKEFPHSLISTLGNIVENSRRYLRKKEVKNDNS